MNYDFTLLSIGYAQHNGDWNFEHICSSFTRIYWVTEGCGEVTLAGHTHRLTPGNLYLIPALASHSDHSNSRFCHYYLHFLDASMQIYEFYQQYRLPFCIPATEVDQRIIRYLLTLAPDLALQDSDPATYDFPDCNKYSSWADKALKEAYEQYGGKPSDTASPWLGTWKSDSGESFEITAVTDDRVEVIHHHLNEQGTRRLDTPYSMIYTDSTKRSVTEDSDGDTWVYTLTLYDDYLLVQSRYPDQKFYKEP